MANKWYGWAGTILRVNLTKGEVVKEPLSRDFAKKYIGGSGFGVRILYDEVGPEVDALSPDNLIIVGQGPLSGTGAPSSGRYDIITKSPLTGIYLRTNGGGFFAPEMKWAGYDLIVISGSSEKPVYLSIDDDKVELRDASHLWGKDTWVSQEMLRDELGDPNVESLRIGPAGENLCYCSCVISNLSRAAGRHGAGAVWGSKKLKAIAVRGTKGVEVARPDEFEKICLELMARAKKDPLYEMHRKYGTVGTVSDPYMKAGTYYSGGDVSGLLGDVFGKEHFDKSLACFNCDIGCGHWYSVKKGKYKGTVGDGPEALPVMRAWICRINDAAFVLKYNTLCNQLGMDVSHPGYAIKWAMELYENGTITKEDTGGVELTWGNQEAFLEMLEKMAYKQGFGAVLDSFSKSGDEMLKIPHAYVVGDPKGGVWLGSGLQGSTEFSLGLSVATRGRDHLTGAPDATYAHNKIPQDILKRVGKERYGDPDIFIDEWSDSPLKAKYVYDVENSNALYDMTGTCKFRGEYMLYVEGYHKEDIARLLSAATGIDFSLKDVLAAGEREMLLERSFNARQGIRRMHDYPAPFYWEAKYGEPHPLYKDAKLPLTREQYEKILDEYYRLRGCDLATGIPTRAKLEEVGLGDVAADLARRKLLPAARKK